MTPEELENNKDLLETCAREVEAKVRAGQNPDQAKLEVFKAHGIEFDVDAAKAQLVGSMQLSDEELAQVTGGVYWCTYDHNCFTVYRQDKYGSTNLTYACLHDYNCVLVYHFDISCGFSS